MGETSAFAILNHQVAVMISRMELSLMQRSTAIAKKVPKKHFNVIIYGGVFVVVFFFNQRTVFAFLRQP